MPWRQVGNRRNAAVYIWRDAATGDVVLSRRPPPRPTWQDFMALRAKLGADSELASLRDREQPAQPRDPLNKATLLDVIGLPAGDDCIDFDPPRVQIVPRIPDLDDSDANQEPKD